MSTENRRTLSGGLLGRKNSWQVKKTTFCLCGSEVNLLCDHLFSHVSMCSCWLFQTELQPWNRFGQLGSLSCFLPDVGCDAVLLFVKWKEDQEEELSMFLWCSDVLLRTRVSTKTAWKYCERMMLWHEYSVLMMCGFFFPGLLASSHSLMTCSSGLG